MERTLSQRYNPQDCNGVANKQTNFLDSELSVGPVLIADLILSEVLQGFAKESDYQLAKQKLLQLSMVEIGGRDVAVKAAENFRFLRRKGATIRKTIGCFIATFCIEKHLPLLHRDRDFNSFVKHLGLRTPNLGK